METPKPIIHCNEEEEERACTPNMDGSRSNARQRVSYSTVVKITCIGEYRALDDNKKIDGALVISCSAEASLPNCF